MKPKKNYDQQKHYISLKEVIHITGLSKASIYWRIKKHNFPSNCNINGKKVGWEKKQVFVWMVQHGHIKPAPKNIPTSPFSESPPIQKHLWRLKNFIKKAIHKIKNRFF